METVTNLCSKLITRVNGVDIVSLNYEKVLIPIRPICEAIGIDYPTQYQKIKDDELLASKVGLNPTVGADGKMREMVCLPLEFVFGWLFSINPKNVKEEAKETVSKYRLECYMALFNHFFTLPRKQIETNEIEIGLLEKLSDLNNQKTSITSDINTTKKKLEQIRSERLEKQQTLFQ